MLMAKLSPNQRYFQTEKCRGKAAQKASGAEFRSPNWPSDGSADLEYFGELIQGKAHKDHQAHAAMARATCRRLVIRHFDPEPTSETRFCTRRAARALPRD
jgi:hypothetical protein